MSSTRRSSDHVAAGAEALATLALALYLGGLVALGAFAAPEVFGRLPRETAGSVMGPIFRTFDGAVIACVLVFAIAELVRARVDGLAGALAKARAAAAAVVVGCGLIASLWLGPRIQDLFEGGARRGAGDAGAALDTAHRRAEAAGKLAVAAGAAWLATGAFAARRRRSRSE